jgi:dihydrofolate synthase/folylpolyglutamate synthase
VADRDDDSADFAAVDAELLERGFTRMVFEPERIRTLLDLLGNPQRAFRAIHLTGTNGKTSSARMIDSLLRTHGVRTGRYTSPHLETVRERISIDGEPISERRFVEVYEEIAPMVAMVDAEYPEPVTYFELTTAMAFAAFADAPVDVAVVEVGLGGATDATNVLHAPVCVLTPVGLDHSEWLGDTIAEITTQKMGIVHEGATLIAAAQVEEAVRPIVERCAEMDATLAREGSEFGVLRRQVAIGGQLLNLQGLGEVYSDVFLPLHGAHQAQNAAVSLAAVEALFGAGAGGRALSADLVREGFAQVSSPGRLERVRTSPTVLLDAAHNPAGMTATVAALTEEFEFRRLVVLVAALTDKDVSSMLELLEPVADEIVVSRNSSSRAMPVAQLAALATEIFGADRVHVEPQLPDAIQEAVGLSEQGEDPALGGLGVLITGSVVTVADARKLLLR